jgi:hypothetical protein
VYHRLASAQETDRPFGLGNSLSALLFGRDDGEYYRATGGRLTYAPAPTRRLRLRSSAFVERQTAVEQDTDLSLLRLVRGSEHSFRPNLTADPADLVGANLWLSSWWGIDPSRVQAGSELLAEASTGTHSFARSRLTARAIVPAGARHRLGLEIGGGTSWGEVPAQYHWFLGGSETLRGYEPSVVVGRSFVRGRGEIARGTGRATLALFGDVGWAGERSDFTLDDTLLSAGVGASFLEGAVRVDVARALRHSRGWTIGVYLDGLL